jgi:L-lactate dehydrogenase complex protein LldG
MNTVRKTRSTARESILASIRENLALSVGFDDAHLHSHSNVTDTSVHSRTSISRAELIDNFKHSLQSVGGHCHIVSNESEAAATVCNTIKSLAATKIAISDSPLVETVVGRSTGTEMVKNAEPEYLFGSDVGITSAQWAIAETGTLVLESAAERHRLTSLVPPVHICILKADSIRQTLREILDLIGRDLSRTVTFVTGASRTSDIELTLAIGVHGPRELHVILIEDRPS